MRAVLIPSISADEAWKLLVEATKEICEKKNYNDCANGETFSKKLNNMLYHMDKMGMSSVADRYRNWYRKSFMG